MTTAGSLEKLRHAVSTSSARPMGRIGALDRQRRHRRGLDCSAVQCSASRTLCHRLPAWGRLRATGSTQRTEQPLPCSAGMMGSSLRVAEREDERVETVPSTGLAPNTFPTAASTSRIYHRRPAHIDDMKCSFRQQLPASRGPHLACSMGADRVSHCAFRFHQCLSKLPRCH